MTAGDDKDAAPPAGVRTMAIVRWALVALMAVIAVASIAFVLRHARPSTGASVATPAATQYYCPMHPAIVQDHPGECPICNMRLVPRAPSTSAGAGAGATASDGGAPGIPGLVAIDLSPERIQLLGMRTAKVIRTPLVSQLRTVGVVSPNEGGLAQISTRYSGWIQELAVSETGQQVRRGQVLASIYSPEIQRAAEEFLAARRWSAGVADASSHTVPNAATPGDLSGDARNRLALLGISEPEIAELARAGRVQPTINLRSPVNGTVIRKAAVVGLYVQPGMELFGVADLSTVWFVADVYQQDLARVRVGQTARLQLAAYPGETFTGRVQFLYPTVDPTTQTMRVRLEFRNRRSKLRPGLYGTVSLDLGRGDGLAVPADAVVDTGEDQYVFVAAAGGRFTPRRVKVGARTAVPGGQTLVQIAEGLAEGETVVTTANFLLDSESRLRAGLDGHSAEAPSHAGQH